MFPSRGPVPAPTSRRRRRRRRPSTASPSYVSAVPYRNTRKQSSTVQLADWSSKVPVNPIHMNSRHLYRRSSLFPADGARRRPKRSLHVVPSAPVKTVDHTMMKEMMKEKCSKKNRRGKQFLKYDAKLIARAKSLGVTPKLHAYRRNLEKDVLDLAASKLVDLTSPMAHKRMLLQASQSLQDCGLHGDRTFLTSAADITKNLNCDEPDLVDRKLIDIRTHGKIFRSYIPFERQWLDMWGAQDSSKSNCNAHCVRALHKWEEVRAAGRRDTNTRRAAQSKLRRKRVRKRHGTRSNRGRGGEVVEEEEVPASIANIVQQTLDLLS